MKRTLSLILVTALLACLLVGCGHKPTTGAVTAPDYTDEITGYIARFESGTVMLLTDSYGAIVLGGDMNFDSLESGNKVTIYCDGVEETFPCGATVKEMIFHEKGSVDNLSEDTLDTLAGLGYKNLVLPEE